MGRLRRSGPDARQPLLWDSGHSRTVFARIADHPVRLVHDLLPWNMADIRYRPDQWEAA
jgi:hypothetical protein